MLKVDPSSPLPPFEQVRAQIATMISAGVLTEGTRVPTIRQLAKDLGLASGTVARSYRELELSGLLIPRGRHGTFVAPVPDRMRRRSEVEGLLAGPAQTFAMQARQLGVDATKALEIVRKAFDGPVA
ncbi:MAG TPA: GntR family transcriptional regulator [Actinomycetota bacterium]|nr:GntR family transcriptional regulator [Actinomycetota bacterium]